MSKKYICKSKFHVCYNFFRYENPRRKNFNPSCPKQHKIVNWNKKWHNFYFNTTLWCLRSVSSFRGIKKKCENKRFMLFSPLIPLRQQGLRVRFVKLLISTISSSLTIETHKNIDTFRVTNKQYYKIILF